ncbi:MAG: hypothetical protein KKC51_11595 [Verrucomicrobia bacterium]|nr:hypothetical protein [Verrucomicrobiota bacterium]
MTTSQVIALLVAIGCLPGQPAGADDPPVAPAKQAGRSYSGRVQMHSVSMEVASPDTKDETRPGAKEVMSLDFDGPADAFLQEFPRLFPLLPPAAVRSTRKSSRRQDWLLPEALNVKTDKEIADEERRASGWGWLADDIKTRGEKKETKEKTSEDESAEDLIRREEAPSGISGMFLEQVFDRRAAATVLQEVGVRDAQDLARIDGEGLAAGASSAQEGLGAAPWRQQESALEDAEALHRENDSPGRDTGRNWSPWEREKSSLMPRSEALLSRTTMQETEPDLPADQPSRMWDTGPVSVFPPNAAGANTPSASHREWGMPAKAGGASGSALPGSGWANQGSTSVKPGSLFGSAVTPPTFGAPAPSFQSSQGFEAGRLANPLRPWSSPLPSAFGTWQQPADGSK